MRKSAFPLAFILLQIGCKHCKYAGFNLLSRHYLIFNTFKRKLNALSSTIHKFPIFIISQISEFHADSFMQTVPGKTCLSFRAPGRGHLRGTIHTGPSGIPVFEVLWHSPVLQPFTGPSGSPADRHDSPAGSVQAGADPPQPRRSPCSEVFSLLPG